MPSAVIGFRVRVNINDNDGDWEMVCNEIGTNEENIGVNSRECQVARQFIEKIK